MKKSLSNGLLITSFMFLNTNINAQQNLKLSLDAGYTYSNLKTDLSNLVDSKYKARSGFGVNLSAELPIWKGLFISTGISYLQKNYEFQRTGSRSGWYTKYDNDFLSFPLLFGGYIIHDPYTSTGVWLKVAGGMFLEYWLSMKREGQYPVFAELQESGTSYNYTTVSDRYDFKENENGLRRFGFGLQGLGQLGYSFEKLDVFASYIYQYGLSDIMKYNTNKKEEIKRNSYMISAGVSYKFK